jgi:hypothetical protein
MGTRRPEEWQPFWLIARPLSLLNRTGRNARKIWAGGRKEKGGAALPRRIGEGQPAARGKEFGENKKTGLSVFRQAGQWGISKNKAD